MRVLYSTNHTLFEKQDTYSLRGICMLLIIMHHVYHYLANDYGVVWENSLFSYCINSAGYWSTGCFFLLSGYGLNLSLKSKELNLLYVKTHLQKLILPYLYAYAINIVLTGNLSMFSQGWFFKTILAIYVISFIIYHFIKNQKLRLTIVSSIIIAYIIYANAYLGLMHYYTNSVICFPIGILCSMSFPTEQKKYYPFILLCFGFVLFVGLEKIGFSYADYILAILFSFICIYITSILNVTCCLLDYIGKNSIVFYVLQIALLEPMLKIESPWIYGIGVFVVIYTLAYIYIRWRN